MTYVNVRNCRLFNPTLIPPNIDNISIHRRYFWITFKHFNRYCRLSWSLSKIYGRSLGDLTKGTFTDNLFYGNTVSWNFPSACWWMKRCVYNQVPEMYVPLVRCLMWLLCACSQMQLPLLGPCIQSYVDVSEMTGPYPLLSHSESFKTIL